MRIDIYWFNESLCNCLQIWFNVLGIPVSMWKIIRNRLIFALFYDQKKCWVSDLDENEDVDRLVYDGDPYLLDETVYECQDGRWIKRGMKWKNNSCLAWTLHNMFCIKNLIVWISWIHSIKIQTCLNNCQWTVLQMNQKSADGPTLFSKDSDYQKYPKWLSIHISANEDVKTDR